jgi:hypothetical protein
MADLGLGLSHPALTDPLQTKDTSAELIKASKKCPLLSPSVFLQISCHKRFNLLEKAGGCGLHPRESQD